MTIDPMLINCLQSYEKIELSTDPDISGLDETIIHIIKGYGSIETKTGSILFVHLENPQSGEEYTYSYPDVVKTECVSRSDRHDKWYIYSLDRSEFKHGTRNKTMIYRLIFKK
ncbi:hypothetical protein ABI952_09155 [Bacillus velezensis]|uniref:hypothetical protein n=1 Tax=Bacillus velezensis TaxID=492670 RepID=UPI003D1A0F05